MLLGDAAGGYFNIQRCPGFGRPKKTHAAGFRAQRQHSLRAMQSLRKGDRDSLSKL